MTGPLLIVDDESDIRRMLRLVLAAVGWTVEEAVCGDDALERCRRYPEPAAVVLDQRMPPGPSGMEVVRLLRAEGFTAPIVLHSAHVTPAVQQEARAIGVDLIAKGEMRALLQVLTPLLTER
jgi:CheY-like chemotaxis protein